MTSNQQDSQPKKTRRWPRWVLVFFCLLMVAGFTGWLYVKNVVRSNLESELTKLGIGKPRIGAITLGTGGIEARDIQFTDTNSEDDPWLSIGKLNIRHPLNELGTSGTKFNELEIDGTSIKVNLDEQSDKSPIDFSTIKLPAKKVILSDASITLLQQNKPDLTIQGISATLSDDDGLIAVDGTVEDLLGSQWNASGTVDTTKQSYDVVLSAKEFSIVDGQWQDLPGVPDSIGKYLRADATADINLRLAGSGSEIPSPEIDLLVSSGELLLPYFDLPITIKRANASVKDGELVVSNFDASTDGTDQINGNATSQLTGFPIETQFSVDFEDLNVATIRKLAPDIPTSVTGNANGTATGAVTVERSLRTKLTIDAKAQSSTAAYGAINANQSDIDVKIDPLVLDSGQQIESLAGHVNVNASAVNQSAKSVFQTFELESLNQQLEIDANANGHVSLELPLATIQKIETWKLAINADSKSGLIAGQILSDIHIEANLESGNLVFSQIKGKPIEQSGEGEPFDESSKINQPAIDVRVDWPIAVAASHPDVGILELTGDHVPANWLKILIDRQMENATGNAANQVDSIQKIDGSINFRSGITIDAVNPEKIESWSGDGNVYQSTVSIDGHELNDLRTNLKIDNNQISFINLQGVFRDGGNVTANTKLNLNDGSLTELDATTADMPLKWIANIAAQIAPDVANVFRQTSIQDSTGALALDGNLSASFKLNDNATQTPDAAPWIINANIKSDEIFVKGQRLENLALFGDFGSQQIRINNGQARLDGGGSFDVRGSWQLENGVGQSQISWEKLPLDWLASFGIKTTRLKGETSGSIQISNNETADGNTIPVTVAGSVVTSGLEFGIIRTREIGFDVRTEGNELVVDQFHADGDLNEIDLSGKVSLTQPYQFSADGTITSLPLSHVFKHRSVTDAPGETIEISGVANAKLNVAGKLDDFDWTTTGELTVSKPRINGELQSDIDAQWKHLGNDWKNSTAVIKAFGGQIKLAELNDLPQRVKVDIDGIDAREVSLFANWPVEFTGTLSGDASLNDWSLAETRWADMNLKGASVLLGPAEFGDLTGSASYRKDRLEYSLNGLLLGGKFESKGETEFLPDAMMATSLPLSVEFTNGALGRIYGASNTFTALRPLMGSLSAKLDLVFAVDAAPVGNGVVKINDLKWGNELLTKEISSGVKLTPDALELNSLRADLKRGEVSGLASIPITSQGRGSYQLNLRQFDLEKLIGIVSDSKIKKLGLLNGRLSGSLGETISGQGTLGLTRSKSLGLTGETLQIPVQFQFDPAQQRGRFEIRQSKFRVFKGNVAGSAVLNLGRSVDLKTDLKLSNLDTEKLFSALSGAKGAGQGDLSGRLILTGNSIRSARDLKGSFKGKLVRAEAFKLPLLDQVARFLGGSQLQSRDFESDDIELNLSQGKIEVRKLNVGNSLAQIAITGNAYLDGRLDLDVAARIQRLNQPTLLEQLAGSPLSRFRGSPVAVFAQAADFLSERLVFLKIGGTIARPQVRPSATKQVQEEAIRYFLRGSQILPNADSQNN